MAVYTIDPSTELMENYRQTTVMAPEQQLQALQDADGHLLVFSIGSAHSGASLNLTVEVPGDRHGWRTVTLTSTLPAQPCRFFSVRRSGPTAPSTWAWPGASPWVRRPTTSSTRRSCPP